MRIFLFNGHIGTSFADNDIKSEEDKNYANKNFESMLVFLKGFDLLCKIKDENDKCDIADENTQIEKQSMFYSISKTNF